MRLLPTLSDMVLYHPLFFDDNAIASLEGSDVQGALRKRRYSEVEAFNSKFVDDISAVLELEVRPPKKSRVPYSTSNKGRWVLPREHIHRYVRYYQSRLLHFHRYFRYCIVNALIIAVIAKSNGYMYV